MRFLLLFAFSLLSAIVVVLGERVRLRPPSLREDGESMTLAERRQLRLRPFSLRVNRPRPFPRFRPDSVHARRGPREFGINLIAPPTYDDSIRRVPRAINVECREEDRQQVLKCFKHYFANFDLSLTDNLLPTIFDIYHSIRNEENYDTNQQLHAEFAGCYRSTPEACYHSRELRKIAREPEEADQLSTFFSTLEYIYKSRHHKRVVDCFVRQLSEMPSLTGATEQDAERCAKAETVLNRAIADFDADCSATNTRPSDLPTYLHTFIRRSSLGTACPALFQSLSFPPAAE